MNNNEKLKTSLLVFGLLAVGYIAGAATPSALAYTQDDNRLLNKISGNLGGINKSLQTIARKIK